MIIWGIFCIGVSVGYVVGYYVNQHLNYNFLFYISALIMGIGCFFLIYGSLFINNSQYGNKKKYNK